MRRGQMKMAAWVSFSVFGRREHTQGADMNISILVICQEFFEKDFDMFF